jgi:DNA-binding transcriptional regulator YdaS (Cro superfamily)
MPSIFERKTNGDALKSIADTLSALTFDEMIQFAEALGVDPKKVNQWAKDYLMPPAVTQTPVSTQ